MGKFCALFHEIHSLMRLRDKVLFRVFDVMRQQMKYWKMDENINFCKTKNEKLST